MGARSRRKGASGELELAHWLTGRGYPAERGRSTKAGLIRPMWLSRVIRQCTLSANAASAYVYTTQSDKPWPMPVTRSQSSHIGAMAVSG